MTETLRTLCPNVVNKVNILKQKVHEGSLFYGLALSGGSQAFCVLLHGFEK